MPFLAFPLVVIAVLNLAICQTYTDDVINEVATQQSVEDYNRTSNYDDVIVTSNDTYQSDNLNTTNETCGVCIPKRHWMCKDGVAILLTPEEDVPVTKQIVQIIVYIGFSISLAACIVANVIYIIARRALKHTPYHIHWNLIMSFTLYHVVFLIDLSLLPTCYVNNLHARNLLHVLLAYTVLANFFWMLVEGLILFFIVVKSFFSRQEGKDFIKWCVLGWGAPALLVIIWIVVEKLTLSGNCVVPELKVSSPKVNGIVCLVAPVFVILLINGIVLVTVIRNVSRKLRACNHNEQKNHRRTAKSTFVLLILLGIYYAIPILVSLIGQPCLLVYIVAYIGQLVSCVQGLAVSALYVFCNGEVREKVGSGERRTPQTIYAVETRKLLTGTTQVSTSSSSKRNSSSTGSESSRHHQRIQQIAATEMKPLSPDDINSNAEDSLKERDRVIMEVGGDVSKDDKTKGVTRYERLDTKDPDV